MQTDDMNMPVGVEGLRRFVTGPGSGGPESTAAVLLGRRGHAAWATAERERGHTVPAWEVGERYPAPSGPAASNYRPNRRIGATTIRPFESAEEVVDRIIEHGLPARQAVQGEQGWRHSFPDAHVPTEIDQLVREGQLADVSQAGGEAPTFVRPDAMEEGKQLVVQSVHPQDRKFADLGRFVVAEGGMIQFDSDDLRAALAHLETKP